MVTFFKLNLLCFLLLWLKRQVKKARFIFFKFFTLLFPVKKRLRLDLVIQKSWFNSVKLLWTFVFLLQLCIMNTFLYWSSNRHILSLKSLLLNIQNGCYELQHDFVALSYLKEKGMANIPHIPDRSLWSYQWWTHCSRCTLSWLQCWKEKKKKSKWLYNALECDLTCKVFPMFWVVMRYNTASPLRHSSLWCLLSL